MVTEEQGRRRGKERGDDGDSAFFVASVEGCGQAFAHDVRGDMM